LQYKKEVLHGTYQRKRYRCGRQSLAAYLKANDYEMGTFVVECNEEIIHKEDYENYMLKDGDIIEIVQFMGGGCGTSLMYRSIM
jgi:sulfur carrier protein